jgi:hypothetical protein
MYYIVVDCIWTNHIDPLSEQLTLRLTRRDLSRLKTLRKRIPIASHNAIAREALRLGIEALERDPGHLLRTNPGGGEERSP